jgi:hypothetical protein
MADKVFQIALKGIGHLEHPCNWSFLHMDDVSFNSLCGGITTFGSGDSMSNAGMTGDKTRTENGVKARNCTVMSAVQSCECLMEAHVFHCNVRVMEGGIALVISKVCIQIHNHLTSGKCVDHEAHPFCQLESALLRH